MIVTESFTPVRRDDIASVELDGQTVCYDTTTGRVHALNPTASLVWNCLQVPGSVGEVVDDIVAELGFERSAVLSALALLVLVVSPSPVVVMFGPFVVGMCIALVMPTCLALAGERIQGNPGALFGGLLTLAQIGGMVLPASIGLVAQYTSVRLGLALLVGSYSLIAVLVRSLSSDDFLRPAKAE